MVARPGLDCEEFTTQNLDSDRHCGDDAVPFFSESAPIFTVTKVARGQGRYEITFNGGCGNQSRCVPTVPESRARFTAFVLGEESPPPSE